MGSALPHRERDSGGADDLVGPYKTLPVSGEEALRAERIEPSQPFAKPNTAQKPMELESLLPDGRGDFGNRRETTLECTDVKAGAADENRQPPRSCRRRDLVERQGTPVGN